MSFTRPHPLTPPPCTLISAAGPPKTSRLRTAGHAANAPPTAPSTAKGSDRSGGNDPPPPLMPSRMPSVFDMLENRRRPLAPWKVATAKVLDGVPYTLFSLVLTVLVGGLAICTHKEIVTGLEPHTRCASWAHISYIHTI